MTIGMRGHRQFVHWATGLFTQLRRDYQSSALWVALPSILYIRELHTFRLHTKLPTGSMRHNLLQGIDQNVVGWNPGSPENCQCCATHHRRWQSDSRASTFPNLHEASLGRDSGKFLARGRSQKCLCGATPQVIDYNLKT